jgi:hypothetical protein
MLSMVKSCCSQNFKADSFSLIFIGSPSKNPKILSLLNRLTALADFELLVNVLQVSYDGFVRFVSNYLNIGCG